MDIEIRSARYAAQGGVDCEINHPEYGWIPFTASPDDPEQFGRDIHAAITQGEVGEIAPAPPPPLLTEDDLRREAIAETLEQYKTAPPSTLAEKVELLEVILGLREPSFDKSKVGTAREITESPGRAP